MESLKQDLTYGLRSLRRNPMFASVATLTLALAIGVNTAIFSIVGTIIFADLPMQDAETVSVVRGVNPELGVTQGSVSVPDYLALIERTRSFASIDALTEDQWVLTGLDQPQRITGYVLTANLLRQWHQTPILGRDFAEGEDQPGAPPVAMLSHPFWQSQFAGDRGVLGQTLRLDGTEYTIIGVTSDQMSFADFGNADVWAPLIINRDGAGREVRNLFVTTRLAEGVSQEQATLEVEALGEALAGEFPETNAGWDLWSAPVMESLINEDGKTIMLLLMLTVGFVILIACANVANMLLARATARAKELSVRAALGAGRVRILRQLMTESFVISISSALLGLALAKGLIEGLIRISNGQEQVFLMAEMNGNVLGYTLMVSLVTPLVFGLLPALRASDNDANAALREGRNSDGNRKGKRTRGILVGAQIALALSLMVVAGLMVRTVYNINSRELGFDPSNLVAMQVDLPENNYPDESSRRRFFDRVVSEISAVPSVTGVAMTDVIPGAGFGSRRGLEIEGQPVAQGQARPPVSVVTVSPNYFDALGLPVISGRAFSSQDAPETMRVAIVTRDLANQYWPNDSPIGRRIRTGTEESDWLQVVGVTQDVRSRAENERPAQNIYVPYAQNSNAGSLLVSRTGTDVGSIAGALRGAVWAVDGNQPIDRLLSFDQALYDASASNYAILSLFVTFAILALFMAGIGVYGVMSYAVSQRTAEIGLRMALGAEVATVRMMVVKQGIRILLIGIASGLAIAFAISRLLSGVVVGISATDPVTFIGVPVVLGGVALVANLIPAIRATRTDPVTALRGE
jgi:putative ABC transport system permease protein